MLKNKILSAIGGVSEPSDPYFKNTTLLLHGDGTNGAQNNTFIDSSPNNFTITRNGNATQGSFSPFSKEPGKWGVSFDGNGDYLSAPHSTQFEFGSGDFTVEAWIYLPTTSSNYDVIAASWLTGNSTNDSWYFGLSASNQIVGGVYTATSTLVTSNGAISNNIWTHVAFVRNGGSLYLFINGVRDAATGSVTGVVNNGTYPLRIGGLSSGYDLNGAISNLRIIKGTALYTSNFTPSTTPLTAVSDTSLLCCQDNRFKDNSSNNFTLTPYGDVKVTPFSPFVNSTAYNPAVNGGSGYFDGNTDALTVNGVSSSVGDFCLEMWFHSTVSLATGVRVVCGEWGGVPGNLSLIRFNGGNFEVNLANTAVLNVAAATHTFVAAGWQHMAITRSGSTLRLFANGIQVASATFSTSVNFSKLNIGGERFGAFNTECWAGYLTDSRVVIGSAVYTSNFTPPTFPLTAVTNTSLLLNFTNAGIFDHAGMNNLETVDNAQISTSVKKFGTGSMYFDGNGDYLTKPIISGEPTDIRNGPCTIEGWVYLNSLAYGVHQYIVGDWKTGAGPGPSSWVIGVSESTLSCNTVRPGFSYYDAGPGINASTQISTNTWYHFALVGTSTNTYFFVNGNLIGSVAYAIGGVNNTVLGIGANPNFNAGSPASFLNGYIDDLRITKGIARYTANFTPPAQAFPNK